LIEVRSLVVWNRLHHSLLNMQMSLMSAGSAGDKAEDCR